MVGTENSIGAGTVSGTEKSMVDESSRRDAIVRHDKTLLVEAGAGTGKTSVMSGRIAFMLAEGVEPENIAAITFTELAASELIERIRTYVTKLANVTQANEIPKELQFVFHDGLTDTQRDNIRQASGKIDEITCTTIHGFCNKLIGIYPVEADIDPGASNMDDSQAQGLFDEKVENWLRGKLSGEESEVKILTELVLHNPDSAVELVNSISEQIRKHRTLNAPETGDIGELMNFLVEAVEKFEKFVKGAKFKEEDSIAIASEMKKIAPVFEELVGIEEEKRLFGILEMEFSEVLVTKAGGFKSYQKKGRWVQAARDFGFSKADGENSNDEATRLYNVFKSAWNELLGAVASKILEEVIESSKEILTIYSGDKRQRAQMDFDDMIFFARDLLKNHDVVRQELGKRFKYVLVDEFQDTDPVQNEILWRLCGNPPKESDNDCEWQQYIIRPGALFLVGDPKQAIYRFRGADINSYTEARENLLEQDPSCLIKITTNFRSYSKILDYVNKKFEVRLSEKEGQPGFTPLEPNLKAPDDNLCVKSLKFEVEERKSESFRRAEAQALAKLCGELIGNHMVFSKEVGDFRPCQPGDIALLAPTSSDFWIYENELERQNIPITTPVGKGFYRRQEVKDLIALTRILADGSDSLALGAFLRGPLVGLAEETLMDIVWNLSNVEGSTENLVRLTINSDSEKINHDLAKEVVNALNKLYKKRNLTTPFILLSEAVDQLRIRPLLRQRYGAQVDRALANVESYLNSAKAFDVRGIREFSESMNDAWSEEEKEVEGHPDTKEDAVALNSIHSAKGLEWPIVVPINTATRRRSENYVFKRCNNTLYCKVLGFEPTGFSDAKELEEKEQNRERVRLFYVAMTRAKEMLIIPRPIWEKPITNTWAESVNLFDAGLPEFELSDKSKMKIADRNEPINEQSREVFKAEAEVIRDVQTILKRKTPSRDEKSGGIVEVSDDSRAWMKQGDDTSTDVESKPRIKGSYKRGEILHKLMEEVINGLVLEEFSELENRASELIVQFGETESENAEEGLSAKELAESVIRTLNLPEIKELLPDLQAEFNVYGTRKEDEGETAMSGVVDAIAFNEEGNPHVIIDWKSTVKPDESSKKRYKDQVRAYLEMTGAQRGLVVYMTSGDVDSV